ncbi:PREDICTED: putative calcium-transporting ATPase 13, plasma membrane-type [Ipomoea nil]|uniref:putative calcium-transporting ATPase 13, plasma membrane-type n=1 Tax=Ipomoea nil TaxID=35883 RepID=UPI000900A9BC|nr:PREDICTED: putative calcium-transporting ATPase 13, plasma membrane-type [Ipomoea nil]
MAPASPKPADDTMVFIRSMQKPRKRWQKAYRAICFLVFLTKKRTVAKKSSGFLQLLSSRSFVAIAIEDKDHKPSFDIDKNMLSDMVSKRDMDGLSSLGGVKAMAALLEADEKGGIDGSNAAGIEYRVQVFGSNTYKKAPAKSFFSFVLEAFKDTTIVILLICAVLSLGFGIKEHGPEDGWYDGGSIILAIFLVLAVSSISNYKQSRQFLKLSNESSNIKVEVVRDGHRQKVSIFDIVVGDVVCLKTGDQIPADGLFLDGFSMRVDESSMTGESNHVEVDETRNPFLVSGTKVTDGYGHMLVTSVGMNTSWGQMMSLITHDVTEETPLQQRLNNLTSFIGKVGLSVAGLVLVVMMVRYFTGNTRDESGHKEFIGSKTEASDILNSVLFIIAAAVTIVVVAIPEGLPLAVTLNLAVSMKRMMRDNAMVRKLSACETMGSATTICTDKTGTLTLNQMQVTEFWLGKEQIEKGKSFEIASDLIELIQEGVALNTSGEVYMSASATLPEISGSPTESAILQWAVADLAMDFNGLKQGHEILQVEAFNSQKKRSGALVRKNHGEKGVQTHWKGAAEMILDMCSKYHLKSGDIKALDDEERVNFQSIIRNLACKSLRCVAFAYKVAREQSDMVSEKLEESELTLLGMVGMKDPCRPGAKEAVEACREAGVKIKMITGDNMFTAKAIATECGILKQGDDIDGAVIDGTTFRNYSEQERMAKIDSICIMARSSPFDKLLMVKCLKQKGHVVAVTGDGTNDAPALKEADIGLSMGIQGTEVAKESSDIVILDDNFKSVVTVIKWGRCVFNNIQKFIQFQLTVNIAALTINFVAALSSGEVPLTAVQLLWVNLIMDSLGALALATEQPTDDLMAKKPIGRTEPLITPVMWRNLIAQALYQIIVLLVLQFRGSSIFGVNKRVKDTLIFNTFVFCQVFNEFNARKLEKKNVFKGILKNKLFLGIIGGTIILQVIMVEALNKFAATQRLNSGQWAICIGVAALSWPIGWLAKCIPVTHKHLSREDIA